MPTYNKRDVDSIAHFTCSYCRHSFDRRGIPHIDKHGFVKIGGAVKSCPNCLSSSHLTFRLEERHGSTEGSGIMAEGKDS